MKPAFKHCTCTLYLFDLSVDCMFYTDQMDLRIHFSQNKIFSVTSQGKGHWNISFKPKDRIASYLKLMFLFVFFSNSSIIHQIMPNKVIDVFQKLTVLISNVFGDFVSSFSLYLKLRNL